MLEIPELEASSCMLLRVCGEIEENSSAIRAALKSFGKKPIFVRYKTVLVVIMASTSGHFHIDIVPRARMKGFTPDQPYTTASKAKKLIQGLQGVKLTTSIDATFSLPPSKLPEMIKKQMVKVQSGSISVEQVGGKLKVFGAPFQSVAWWIHQDGNARIQIEASNTLTLGSEYLLNAYAPLESGFQALIADGVSDGPNQT